MRLGMLWQELVAQNPMLIEIQRYKRRFFSFSGSSTLNGIVLGLAIVCYAGILMLVLSARGSIPPIAVVMFQTFLFTLAAPSILYGSIAGERERRTWDLLIAAPITKAQIAVGKFLGALAAIGTGYLLLLLPILITGMDFENTNWYYLFLAELLSFTFAVFAASVTLFFSARCKRGFMALGTVLGLLALSLLVVPIMVMAVSAGDDLTNALVNFFNPFYGQSMLLMGSESARFAGSEDNVPMGIAAWGWPQALCYLGLSAVFVAWAAHTLTFAENDVKFIPKHAGNQKPT